jgi:hypothetical protein
VTPGPTVTAAAEALVGTVTSVITSDPISLRQVREYVAATGGDLDALDDAAELSAPIIAPPLFFVAACRSILAETELLPDGQYPSMGVPGVEGRSMAAGNSFELLAPVYVGDVLTARERLLSLERKSGRSGALVFTETETEYTNQSSTVVARYRQTVVFR